MNQLKNNKKEIFSPLRDYMYLKDTYKNINDVNLSSFGDSFLIDEIKTLKVIELDNLESFTFYINYDHFLIFKVDNDYYFCDTELTSIFGIFGLVKVSDYSLYLRKDKLKNINLNDN